MTSRANQELRLQQRIFEVRKKEKEKSQTLIDGFCSHAQVNNENSNFTAFSRCGSRTEELNGEKRHFMDVLQRSGG